MRKYSKELKKMADEIRGCGMVTIRPGAAGFPGEIEFSEESMVNRISDLLINSAYWKEREEDGNKENRS